VQSNIGYHILQLVEKHDPKLLKLKDPILPGASQTVEERIRNTLRAQAQQRTFQRALSDHIEELQKDAEVTIYEQNLTW
jgi:parvulin-like peptidyl-prolyl isomerase